MILQGNSIRIPLKDESVHAIVTSFPYYGLRSYGLPPTIWGGDSRCQHIWGDESRSAQRLRNGAGASGLGGDIRAGGENTNLATGQFCTLCRAWLGCFGLEPTIGLHVQNAVAVCREIKRVLRRDGVFWLNYGDSYATGKNGRSAADTKAVGKDDRTFRDKPFSVTELPAKNLCGIPWRVALALQDDGWILRSEFPWLKLNAMPSSVTDRPGTAHEHVFMLVKSARYYYDGESVRRGLATASVGRMERKQDLIDRTGTGTLGKQIIDGVDQSHGYAGLALGRNGKTGYNPAGRALRTSDPFFDSLDAYIAHLQDVRDNGGMLVAEWPGEANSEGLPAALVVNTESFAGAHYATFPRKLIAPLIKTTPEKVCPECGKAWVRVTEKRLDNVIESRPDRGVPGRVGNGHQKTRAGDSVSTTTGWQPTCKCGLAESECIGAIILDPFVGSGTVIAVAKEHGRRGIGIDLSAEYLQTNALPRAERLTSQKSLGQLPMFSEAA